MTNESVLKKIKKEIKGKRLSIEALEKRQKKSSIKNEALF
jgi:hypothetical protein